MNNKLNCFLYLGGWNLLLGDMGLIYLFFKWEFGYIFFSIFVFCVLVVWGWLFCFLLCVLWLVYLCLYCYYFLCGVFCLLGLVGIKYSVLLVL